jgi:hypothetical protein
LEAGPWLAQAAASSGGCRALIDHLHRLITCIDRFTIKIQSVEDCIHAGNPANLRELWSATATEFPRGDDLFV